MKPSTLLLFSVLAFWVQASYSQDSTRCKILTPSPTLNKPRVYAIAGTWTAVYSGTLIGLNELWYKNYPRSSFHFFDDIGEWQQIDKFGHAYTASFESKWSIEALRWAGLKDKQAIWLGGSVGPLFQTTIEILDGFSSKWGASWTDLAANELGAAIVISQELAWHEQRISFKFSVHKVSYDDPVLRQRATDLYGTGFAQTLIKDYNGQDYWLSVNPSWFMKDESRFPKWLNVAVGYGAGGMFGGFNNTWEVKNEGGVDSMMVDRTNIERYRKFFLAPDIDFTRIKTNSHFLNTLFDIMNIVKVPAPALEFNTKGQVIFHTIYALNWDTPLFISK